MTPPTRPEPFDPRDADPLTVMGFDPAMPGAERTVLIRRDPDGQLRVLREQRRPRRLGSPIWTLAAVAAGLVIWALVFLVFHAVATPRSAPDPTASRPGDPGTIGSVDVSAQAQASASGPELSGAPQPLASQRSDGLGRSERAEERLPGAPTPAGDATSYRGSLAWAAESHGTLYLALREPRGTRVEVCGSAACLTRTSTDFGPIRSLFEVGRIADLSAADFEKVCGMSPAQRILHGLCPGSILVLSRRPATPLPATDEEGP